MRDVMEIARAHMEAALELLDGVPAPLQIGAHLDLALSQLQQAIEAAADNGAAKAGATIN
jgi:hypothetical protein